MTAPVDYGVNPILSERLGPLCIAEEARTGTSCIEACHIACGFQGIGLKVCTCEGGAYVQCPCPRPPGISRRRDRYYRRLSHVGRVHRGNCRAALRHGVGPVHRNRHGDGKYAARLRVHGESRDRRSAVVLRIDEPLVQSRSSCEASVRSG